MKHYTKKLIFLSIACAIFSKTAHAEALQRIPVKDIHTHLSKISEAFVNNERDYIFDDYWGSTPRKFNFSYLLDLHPNFKPLKQYKLYCGPSDCDASIDEQLFQLVKHSNVEGLRNRDTVWQRFSGYTIAEMQRLGLTVGQPLTHSQQRQLSKVIYWPEVVTYRGIRTVLPRVYVPHAMAQHFAKIDGSMLVVGKNNTFNNIKMGEGTYLYSPAGSHLQVNNFTADNAKVDSNNRHFNVTATGDYISNKTQYTVGDKTVKADGHYISHGDQVNSSGTVDVSSNYNADKDVYIHSEEDLNLFASFFNKETKQSATKNSYNETTTQKASITQIKSGGRVSLTAKGRVGGRQLTPPGTSTDKSGSNHSNTILDPGASVSIKAKKTVDIEGDKGVKMAGHHQTHTRQHERTSSRSKALSTVNKKTHSTEQKNTFTGSTLIAGERISISSKAGKTEVVGVDAHSKEINLHGAKGVVVDPGRTSKKCDSWSLKKTQGLGSDLGAVPITYLVDKDSVGNSRRETWQNCYQETLVGTKLKATTTINISSDHTIDISQSSHLQAPRIKFKTPGKLIYTLDKVINSKSKVTSADNALFKRHHNKGHMIETPANLILDGEVEQDVGSVEVEFNTALLNQESSGRSTSSKNPQSLEKPQRFYVSGVHYPLDEHTTLDERVKQLSEVEGMQWLKQVINHGDVSISAVDVIHKRWNKNQLALTEEAKIAITIAVAIATGNSGTVAASTALSTNIAAGSATAAAINAAFTALVTKITIISIEHQGDINAIIQEIQKDEHLVDVAKQAVTAGLTRKTLNEFNAARLFLKGRSLPLKVRKPFNKPSRHCKTSVSG